MTNEFEVLVRKSYLEIVNILLEKYGPAKYDYFCFKDCSFVNAKVSRMSEGLYCHHIDEDKAIKLSSSGNAMANPFKYQRTDRLVYCNVLEHLLLHLKIVIEPKHKDANKNEIQGIGGVRQFICPIINDYLSGYKYKNEKSKKAFDIVDNLFEKYIFILRWFFSEYDKDREEPSLFCKTAMSQTLRTGEVVESVYNALIVPDEKDKISAEEINELEKASESGDPEATFELGEIYYIGKKVIINRERAFRYFSESAKKDHLPSILKIAEFYKNGIGVDSDINQAVSFYEKAAIQNSIYAIVQLGKIYLNNYKDYEKAITFFEKAVQMGSLDTYLLLQDTYMCQDKYTDAIVTNQKLINLVKDNEKYQTIMISAYRNLESMVLSKKWNNKLATKWYTQEIESGDKHAIYYLARLYQKMRKTSRNVAKAIALLELCYENNIYEALVDLGDVHLFSNYRLNDVKKALKYYELAGDFGVAQGYKRLASYYRARKDSESDLIKAKEYAKKAKKFESKQREINA